MNMMMMMMMMMMITKLWNFSYVGNLVSCEEEVDIDSKTE
jgi:hypothetical protein